MPGSTVCDGRARACVCVRAEGRPDVASLLIRLRTVLLHGQSEDRRCESVSVCGWNSGWCDITGSVVGDRPLMFRDADLSWFLGQFMNVIETRTMIAFMDH